MPSNCTDPRSFAPIRLRSRLAAAVAIALCAVAPPGFAAAETGDEFVARLNKEFADIALELNAAGWTQATYITVDTQWLSARANERFLAAFSKAVEESKQFDGKPMSADSRRTIELLRLGVPAPAPDDPAKRAELAKIMAGMEAKYGSAKYCKEGSKEC
ncbi:MAG: M2 family metallopeptidase, partial [Steroidobacteraceae bacterium]